MAIDTTVIVAKTRHIGRSGGMPNEWKVVLSELLKNVGLITSETEQVVINCNSGSVCDVKVVTRVK